MLFLLHDQNLNLISVWNPTFLLLLLKKMETHWGALLKDIEHGTITLSDTESDEALSTLKRKIKPKRKRAADLKSLSSKDIDGIWPKLRLVSCWSEANAEPYYQELKAKLGPIEIQGKGLLATECFISFPLVKASHSILALNSHFFEFLPLEEPCDDTKLFHELTVGAQYIPIVTTGGGLYRYNTNDVVEVKGFKQGVPLLKFTGRKDRVSDHFGEKLNEAHVTETLSQVFKRHSTSPAFFMVAFDDLHPLPHYTLYIQTDTIDINIVKEIDQRLDANFHYHYSKELGQLGNLRLFLIDSDGMGTYTRRLQENGMKLGDIKPATLSSYTNWHAYFKGDFIEKGSS
ncbi:MAG: GH3 family domain-containing protein [Bacillota bacterium]